jgi:hypothetical protein
MTNVARSQLQPFTWSSPPWSEWASGTAEGNVTVGSGGRNPFRLALTSAKGAVLRFQAPAWRPIPLLHLFKSIEIYWGCVKSWCTRLPCSQTNRIWGRKGAGFCTCDFWDAIRQGRIWFPDVGLDNGLESIS